MVNPIGRLEVITGSMFSGKSEELIRRIRRAKYAKQKIVVFSPSIDNRYGENKVYSHNKNNVEAHSVQTVEQMEKIMLDNVDARVIGIDEIQFFEPKIVDFCKKYVDLGKRIIVAGLDLDFRAKPFMPLPELMAMADEVNKLSAICTVCGKAGYASQRLINGEPAYEDDPLVLVGASENYEARCRIHHEVRIRDHKDVALEIIISTHKMDNSKIYDILNIREYEIFNLEKNVLLSELKEKIRDTNKLILNISDSLFNIIEREYTILDFITEYRKNANITIVSETKNGLEDYVQTIYNILKNNDLKIKNVFIDNLSK